jgi:hypothetical protein
VESLLIKLLLRIRSSLPHSHRHSHTVNLYFRPEGATYSFRPPGANTVHFPNRLPVKSAADLASLRPFLAPRFMVVAIHDALFRTDICLSRTFWCSHLQHYYAMGGDLDLKSTGKHTNVSPLPKIANRLWLLQIEIIPIYANLLCLTLPIEKAHR